MKSMVIPIISIALLTLAACSIQQVQQPRLNQSETVKSAPPTGTGWANSGIHPPLKIIKDNQSLNLVRIMDGGMCKNNFQGAKGEFLVYANLKDIERIKREKTPEIFKDFENKIEVFSTQVLQEAIEATNLEEDPFSLGEDEAQEKLASKLATNFRNAVKPAVNAFQKETTLTIEVAPFSPSFVFYQKGCNMTKINPES